MEIEARLPKPSDKDINYFCEFKTNLFKGIEYYQEILPKIFEEAGQAKRQFLKELFELKDALEKLIQSYPMAFPQITPKATEPALATA